MSDHDLALGCLTGVFVGDAAGATLEFLRRPVTEYHVAKAMRMEGGGSLNVAPGQFTDDSELAIHLLKALHDKDPSVGMPLSSIAKEYIDWHLSLPFDCGMTCGRAFAFSKDEMDLMRKAKQYSSLSEANGSLMRIAPLAIWCRKLPPHVVMTYAREEAQLSHPNVICQDANALYCLAITYLLQHAHDAKGAVQYCRGFIDKIHPIVANWFNMSVDDDFYLDNIDCTVNIGHVKHAFMLAFSLLKANVTFEEGIRLALSKGGDVDTNAAIVGGILGALHGFEGIPEYMKNPVMEFDPSQNDPNKTLLGYVRPPLYSCKTAVKYLDKMI
jgi:ADP-ribosyl-[dinitrogen reductase] hydrolase